MLKEVNQDPHDMGSATDGQDVVRKGHMAIHQTNLLQPHKLGVTSFALSPNRHFLAARRGYRNRDEVNHPFSQLDIYDTTHRNNVNYLLTILEYEDITGLAWLNERQFLTVSLQATINVYSVHDGIKETTYTSDYGPITCMRYLLEEDLLVTGTEYGYAVAYRMSPKIECVSKMVKLNDPIKAVDLYLRPRDVPTIEMPQAEKKKKKEKFVRAKKPGKRKRDESSEESDENDDDELGANEKVDPSTRDQFMADIDVTIFGACNNRVIAWDYHRKAIVDTVSSEHQVCSLLALSNGDFVIGDSNGFINIHDRNTFTCRQSERILKSSVTCLARDNENTTMLAAGKEPTITVLKHKALSESEDEYILFEQIKDHNAQIEAAIFAHKREFYTCSLDNTIMKFRLSKPKSRRELKRFPVGPNHQSKIHCATNELMFIYGKSLFIHQVDPDPQFKTETSAYPNRQSLAEPRRTCSIKPALIIHAATFDDKWICYSTKHGITTIDRPGLNRLGKPSKDSPACQLLKLCQSGKYLVAGQGKNLAVIQLDNDSPVIDQPAHVAPQDELETRGDSKDGDVTKRQVHRTIMKKSEKSYIRDILYHESTNRLIVIGGTNSLPISVYELPTSTGDDTGPSKNGGVKLVFKFTLQCGPSSYLALNHNDKADTGLYVYTTRNQLIKFDIRQQESFTVDLREFAETTGLPKHPNIKGFAVLSRRYALLHDANFLYKLDMNTNEIVNTSPKYDKINMICDTIFDEQDEILIV